MTQHKIYIDVSEFDTAKRELVQDAFFKLGITWLEAGYNYLEGKFKEYTNIRDSGDVGNRLLYGEDKQPTGLQVLHAHTFNQLMKLAGMEEHIERESIKPFTKDMLISGEHIVECASGKRYLVAGDYFIGESGYQKFSEYPEDLTCNQWPQFTITKVHSGVLPDNRVACGSGFSEYLTSDSLTLVWQRETPESAIKREKKLALSEHIAKMEAEIAQMKLELEGM